MDEHLYSERFKDAVCMLKRTKIGCNHSRIMDVGSALQYEAEKRDLACRSKRSMNALDAMRSTTSDSPRNSSRRAGRLSKDRYSTPNGDYTTHGRT